MQPGRCLLLACFTFNTLSFFIFAAPNVVYMCNPVLTFLGCWKWLYNIMRFAAVVVVYYDELLNS